VQLQSRKGMAAKRVFGAGGISSNLAPSSVQQGIATAETSKRANPDLNPLFAKRVTTSLIWHATTANPMFSQVQQPSSGSKVAAGTACQKIWAQCSGKTTVGGKQVDWPGPSCCEDGCTCQDNGQFYGQCRPQNNGWQCSAPQRLSDNGTDLRGGMATAAAAGGRLWLAPTALTSTVSAALLVSLLAAMAVSIRRRGCCQRQHRQLGHGMHYSLVGDRLAPPRRCARPPLLEQ